MPISIEPSPHPSWVEELIEQTAPLERAVTDGRFFREMADGTLSMRHFRIGLRNFLPLVDAFPQYMGMMLTKVPAGEQRRNQLARDWLIQNVGVERRHVVWYRRWAEDFGVPKAEMRAPLRPPPAMDAVNHFLWRTVTHGSLAQSLAAVNFGIEGPTGIWTKRVKDIIENYRRRAGVKIGEETFRWVNAHASYDDFHPVEALELIKLVTRGQQAQRDVIHAAKSAMTYYAMAADAVYD
jgi:pyrroloquinoline quinone (PQQ) biosynthesis protein C